VTAVPDMLRVHERRRVVGDGTVADNVLVIDVILERPRDLSDTLDRRFLDSEIA
jgi:hypothetical protein